MKEISPQNAADAMAAGTAVILDVREDSELLEAAVDGVRHIPMQQVPERLNELDPAQRVFESRTGTIVSGATVEIVDAASGPNVTVSPQCGNACERRGGSHACESDSRGCLRRRSAYRSERSH